MAENSQTKILFILGSTLFFWFFIMALVLNNYENLVWSLAWSDALVSTGVLGITGFAVTLIIRFYQPTWNNAVYYLIIVVALSWLGSLATGYFVQKLYFDDMFYLKNFFQMRWVLFGLINLVMTMTAWLHLALKNLRDDENRKANTEKISKEAELASLRHQLQPHFLFNSLNSINALIGIKPDEARKMVQQLSDFLRGTVKKVGSQMLSLSEELSHLSLYLEIEKVRFGHRLSTVITIHPATLELKVPALLLQPIVENAIKFGLYDTRDSVIITLKTAIENRELVVEVINPYDPQTAPPKGTGFGLSSIQRRLYLLYARNDLLATSHDGNNFTTRIIIPQA